MVKRDIIPVWIKDLIRMSSNQRIVFTNGCFDLFHPGHVTLLGECHLIATEINGFVLIAVDSDENVRNLKGDGHPIIDISGRLRTVRKWGYAFSFDGPVGPVIKEIQPDILVKGKDWRGNVDGTEYTKKVVLVDMVPGYSTSEIIRKIKALP